MRSALDRDPDEHNSMNSWDYFGKPGLVVRIRPEKPLFGYPAPAPARAGERYRELPGRIRTYPVRNTNYTHIFRNLTAVRIDTLSGRGNSNAIRSLA